MQFYHIMLRVVDLEKSIDFYKRHFHLLLQRKLDFSNAKFTLGFLGYENQPSFLELTYNWDQKTPYDLGNAFGHIAFTTNDIYNVCQKMEEEKVKIMRKPAPMQDNKTVIAFVLDPDGYQIELIQKD